MEKPLLSQQNKGRTGNTGELARWERMGGAFRDPDVNPRREGHQLWQGPRDQLTGYIEFGALGGESHRPELRKAAMPAAAGWCPGETSPEPAQRHH